MNITLNKKLRYWASDALGNGSKDWSTWYPIRRPYHHYVCHWYLLRKCLHLFILCKVWLQGSRLQRVSKITTALSQDDEFSKLNVNPYCLRMSSSQNLNVNHQFIQKKHGKENKLEFVRHRTGNISMSHMAIFIYCTIQLEQYCVQTCLQGLHSKPKNKGSLLQA